MTSFLARFVTGLRYVLAVDEDCADLRLLERRLGFITSMRKEYGLDETYWKTVYCAHDAEPLTYTSRLHDRGGTATIADLATVWREYLHQGLTIATTGTGGHPAGRRALHAFASAPRLVSRIRLTVGGDVEELATDLRIILPLWDVPSDSLGEDTFRLQLAAKDAAAAEKVMLAAGMGPARVFATIDDPRAVVFDRTTADSLAWYGVRTNGALFTNTELDDPTMEKPGFVDQMHLAATRAGWAA